MLAGRPTSKDIEAKRIRLEQMEAEHQARLDSLSRVQASIRDSLAVLDSLKQGGNDIIGSRQISPDSKKTLVHRYYVIIGTFGSTENALRLSGRAEAKGFPAVLIKYSNGFTAVGICPSNTLKEVCSKIKEAVQEPFCPPDAWILDNSTL